MGKKEARDSRRWDEGSRIRVIWQSHQPRNESSLWKQQKAKQTNSPSESPDRENASHWTLALLVHWYFWTCGTGRQWMHVVLSQKECGHSLQRPQKRRMGRGVNLGREKNSGQSKSIASAWDSAGWETHECYHHMHPASSIQPVLSSSQVLGSLDQLLANTYTVLNGFHILTSLVLIKLWGRCYY